MSQESNKKDDRKSTWNIKPYLAVGLTALLVMMIGTVFFFFVYRYEGTNQLFKKLINILQPIVIGVVLAYLLNPLVNLFRKILTKRIKLKAQLSKVLAIAISLILAGTVLSLFCWSVLPKVYKSLEELILKMPQMIGSTTTWLMNYWEENEFLTKYVNEILVSSASYLKNFIEIRVIPQISVIITQVYTGIFSLATGLLNFVIGIIVSVYILMEKEHFMAIGKKLVYGICPRKTGNVIIKTIKKAHSIFSRFVLATLFDAVLVGVVTYIVLSIANIPSALLIGVIVACTNIIPFFGPFIGAIPSFLIVLIQDPVKSIWFVLIILIIQQVDGNIIVPKVLGSMTGLSSFWVVTATLISGGLFGFAGMVLGVPTFALIYYCIDEITKHMLRKKGLPEETEIYLKVKERDAVSGELNFYESAEKEETEAEEEN